MLTSLKLLLNILIIPSFYLIQVTNLLILLDQHLLSSTLQINVMYLPYTFKYKIPSIRNHVVASVLVGVTVPPPLSAILPAFQPPLIQHGELHEALQQLSSAACALDPVPTKRFKTGSHLGPSFSNATFHITHMLMTVIHVNDLVQCNADIKMWMAKMFLQLNEILLVVLIFNSPVGKTV